MSTALRLVITDRFADLSPGALDDAVMRMQRGLSVEPGYVLGALEAFSDLIDVVNQNCDGWDGRASDIDSAAAALEEQFKEEKESRERSEKEEREKLEAAELESERANKQRDEIASECDEMRKRAEKAEHELAQATAMLATMRKEKPLKKRGKKSSDRSDNGKGARK